MNILKWAIALLFSIEVLPETLSIVLLALLMRNRHLAFIHAFYSRYIEMMERSYVRLHSKKFKSNRGRTRLVWLLQLLILYPIGIKILRLLTKIL